MRTKDFIMLPLGIYEATNGVWNYKLEKQIIDDRPIYTITESEHSRFARGLSLFENEDYVFDDPTERRRYGKHKKIYLSALAGVHGLNIYQEKISVWSIFNDFYIKPKGSFKKYVENELK